MTALVNKVTWPFFKNQAEHSVHICDPSYSVPQDIRGSWSEVSPIQKCETLSGKKKNLKSQKGWGHSQTGKAVV
jgi:hypothetical protein